MSKAELAASRIRGGIWDAELTTAGDRPPAIEVWHLEARLEGVEVTATDAPGCWKLSLPIPAAVLNDGVQTFLVRDGANGEGLGHFTIVTGIPLEDDIRAEIDLLRAELDMLKRAFRRHFLETSEH